MDRTVIRRSPEAQAFRAERVIAAASKLASAGGYDAVQMREVAKLAGVSLSTLYRYYPSKDSLIRAVESGQLARLRDDVIARPPKGRSAGTRAAEVFIRAFHAMERDRGYAHAIMCTQEVPRPLDSPQAQREAPEENDFVDIAAFAAWGPDHRTAETEYRALHMLESLWTSSVIHWLNGDLSRGYVEDRLRFAASRLLEAD